MPKVTMTSHLYRFFPALEGLEITVSAGSVADALAELNQLAPNFSDYILDDTGALRRHVNLCINNELIVDRKKLSDQLGDEDTLYIFQALTGG
ncbi:MoaD/ThiS family protein [Teredinibacter turnerae]|uniref:MoaD/ThiS family protein n=1 Tax=Teredinibacter turnerae TaxID=2426 RepID=UPI001E502520|nr:MoaD/ThiS family protein [Teredinibacter turnerae]